jgi:hypothetical protein
VETFDEVAKVAKKERGTHGGSSMIYYSIHGKGNSIFD